MSKLLDAIKADVLETKSELFGLSEELEGSVFELYNSTLDDLLDDDDELLKLIKKQRREFNNKLKVFEANMKKLRDFF